MKPSIKLRLFAHALNIDRARRDHLIDRADGLATVFARDSDVEGLARSVVDGSNRLEEARFVCQSVDEILRRRFRAPFKARSIIFAWLSTHCAENFRNRRLAVASPAVVSPPEGKTRSRDSAVGTKVLVVICDSWLRDWCADTVRSIPCAVVTASDGLTALNELERSDFGAIVCEFFLPVIDGDGLHASLAESKARSHLCDRFIFITGASLLALPRISAFRKQTNATFIALPFSAKTLIETISGRLRSQSPSNENNHESGSGIVAVTIDVNAERLCDSVAMKVVMDLQSITDLLLGEESGLANLWEEICVQRQGDESEMWSTYEETVNALIDAHLEDLSENDRQALWLETDQGIDWECYQSSEEHSDPPISEQDIVGYVAGHVYLRASEFSNKRINAFQSRQSGK